MNENPIKNLSIVPQLPQLVQFALRNFASGRYSVLVQWPVCRAGTGHCRGFIGSDSRCLEEADAFVTELRPFRAGTDAGPYGY